MRNAENFLKENKIVNRSELAKAINISKQALNNKIKGNNKAFITDEEKGRIKEHLTSVLSKVFAL